MTKLLILTFVLSCYFIVNLALAKTDIASATDTKKTAAKTALLVEDNFQYEAIAKATLILKNSFDQQNNFCKQSWQAAPQYSQALKAILDAKINREFGQNSAARFNKFLKKAQQSCRYTCELYAYIYENLSANSNLNIKQAEPIYQKLLQKIKFQQDSKTKQFAKHIKKSFCESALFRQLHKDIQD